MLPLDISRKLTMPELNSVCEVSSLCEVSEAVRQNLCTI